MFARLAVALTPIAVRVRLSELVAVDAVSLRCVEPSRDILGMTDQLKVFRPNAVAVSAATFLDVIPLHPKGRPPYEKMVGTPVPAIREEETISIPVDEAKPEGAAIRSARVNTSPEALFGGKIGRHRNLHSGVMPEAVCAALRLFAFRTIIPNEEPVVWDKSPDHRLESRLGKFAPIPTRSECSTESLVISQTKTGQGRQWRRQQGTLPR